MNTNGPSTSRSIITLSVALATLHASFILCSAQIPAHRTAAPVNSPAPAVAPVAAPAIAVPATNPSSPAAVTANGTSAARTNAMETLDDKHRLAIGDRLSFRIEEDQEDPRSIIVTDSGELELPYIGRFPAENKTCKQLAREVKAELEKDYYYQATVIVAVDFMTKSRGKVYLVGPVRVPGPQEIPSDEVLTLSKAILRAGGFADYADRQNVKVTRKSAGNTNDKQTFVVDVAAILEKGRTELDIPLEPGDLLFVPERMIRF